MPALACAQTTAVVAGNSLDDRAINPALNLDVPDLDIGRTGRSRRQWGDAQ